MDPADSFPSSYLPDDAARKHCLDTTWWKYPKVSHHVEHRESLKSWFAKEKLSVTERIAWRAFKNVCSNFLGHSRAENYIELVVETMLSAYDKMKCNISLKIYFLHSHLDFFPPNLGECAVSSTQKFLVQQHITTSKHQANKQLNSKQRQLFLTQPTTSNVRSEFNIDLCRSLISADIPLYKLKNKVFREFLEKYTQHTIPDESTLRKTYAPSIYDETIQKIRDEIKDSSIWVSIDETP
ncbi:hypothetical protein ANN_18575 [Periplaneta americana]|uniref:Uncharacterized protein n=1 Tax=Periplaneta americana TaxID=6978 RepID=A0ABQ8SQL6_PERAM|nr:hypothetical protein ANN_18575 [Periplaneta americana]